MKDLKYIFEERRSVNFFDTGKKLEKGTLKSIIELASLAPSAFNLQPWSLIAVTSPEAKQRLFKLSNKQQKILDAPVTLIVLGDKGGYKSGNPIWQAMLELVKDKKKVEGAQDFAASLYGSTPERRLKFAESNAGLFAMSLMYAAKYYGVDSHPMSGIDFDGIKKEFGMDDDKEVVMLVSLGYFDESRQLYPRQKRFGYDELVKEE